VTGSALLWMTQSSKQLALDRSLMSSPPVRLTVWSNYAIGPKRLQATVANLLHFPRWAYVERWYKPSAAMGARISITRLDLTATALRAAAGREKDSAAARRMLALALVLDGVDRKTAAETCGMDRQTLRDWVHRYNAEGLAGLRNLRSPGPRSKLTVQQQAELALLVEAGPDPDRHKVVRWRRVDLRDELERRFGVALHERSVGKILAKLGYRKPTTTTTTVVDNGTFKTKTEAETGMKTMKVCTEN
jgi:transposase